MRPHFSSAIAVSLLIVSACSNDSAVRQQGDGSKAPPRLVDYKIIEQWEIPNGGYGKAVVIPGTAANERSLRALGEEFRYDTRADRNAFIFVFSDPRAAAMRLRVLRGDASKKELRLYDDHFVASYTRNINTGFHQLSIMPKGLNGPQIDVSY